ncbi:hypothetical protein PILCRDRAFT_261415 [Piloderma croceum F 1598]|uniref:Uncharacterized protein n=1 Tax=Piloderma croceum (strain F 1598) TaxID=765440 RepID=A0A0C3BMT6_PILCF|nr:hypothetical protein PILCRDRAFT_261415 [Piloderma croceum F 1598]
MESERRRTPTSAHFRDSVHLIPTPVVEPHLYKRYDPLILRGWAIASIACFMMALAIALEAALAVSNHKQGFSVPQEHIFSLISTQFLTTFFPIIFFAPLALLWKNLDQLLRQYQPYVALATKHPSAEESLLLDYLVLNKFASLRRSFYHKHWLVFISTSTALAAILLQPLAGSVFAIKQTPYTESGNVTNTQSVGLAPDTNQLIVFLAAAGYAGASVFDRLEDPPFVTGGWTAAEFTFPNDPLLNGSMTVSTVAIDTKVNCVVPSTFDLKIPGAGTDIIQSTSAQGCSGTVTFDSSSSEQQYGVVPATNCSSATSLNFSPVMFWFFHINAQGKPEAKSVFCQPTIGMFNIQAIANLNNGSLANVTVLSRYTQPNNVTGTQPYNGVVFDTSSSDGFVQARATAIGSEVAGAILRSATQQPNGPQATFDDLNGFLNITNSVYTRHLAFSAKSVYYVPANQTLPAQMTSLVPMIWLQPLAVHALALILLLIALAGLCVHISHGRVRRKLLLTSAPGSIAATVALTSRSGFGELLHPYDDEVTIRRKLCGLRFYLDERTGAILADDVEDDNDDTETLLLDHKRYNSFRSSIMTYETK